VSHESDFNQERVGRNEKEQHHRRSDGAALVAIVARPARPS